MKKEILDILACPICKGPLELTVDKEDEREVINGSLHCAKCSQHYTVKDSIPNLLPPGAEELGRL
ncbi:MAG: methytransferase partner Trm112 [Dehalococcoidia bacterium]|nr:methytransferase partner Trm112 [Dehalococcoidia bacterium]